MNSETQRQALELLEQLWELSPDVRLGQLLAHLGFLGEVHLGRGLGYIDDDEFMSILHRHRAELLARLQPSAPHAAPAASPAQPVSGSAPKP